MDHKDPNLYPEPEDRYLPSDFPPIEMLYIYGKDIPVPESIDDLRCEYRFPEDIGLADLDGYRVPPYGLAFVTKAGGGYKKPPSGAGGWIYPAGTFFRDDYTLNKPKGVNNAEMVVYREEARKNAMVDGAISAFEEMGLAVFDNIKEKDPSLIQELTKQTVKIVFGSENPRESINLLKFITEKLADKDEAINNNKSKSAAMTPEDAAKWIKVWNEAKDLPPIIEGEIEDA